MSDQSSNEANVPQAGKQAIDRRLFLRSLGKWSGAAIAAAIAGSWLASAPEAEAAGWINSRGGWINGGGWVNGGWINGGGWVNRRVGGGGSWVNRR
jgi:hypothetical protein